MSQEISGLKEEIDSIDFLETELKELEDLSKLAGQAGQDAKISEEIEKKSQELEEKIKKQEFKVFLAGKYDRNNAILEIFSGAGGQDSQDWATMLLRMYQRYCDKKGFQAKILHQSFGEPGGPDGRIGTKSATLEIKGNFAYGFLKKESGVHRLVRISPFSAKKLRHTSFALVSVLPEISAQGGPAEGWEIKPEDLNVETFKASGPGGQYVNKTESAVRITHIPSGIVVSSQTERLQGRNKENAMKILYAKLYQQREQEHAKKIKEIKAAQIESGRASPTGGGTASWGNQIRSYVLHPYKMVKDLRTQYETSDTESVLDGNLDEFIEAEMKIHPVK